MKWSPGILPLKALHTFSTYHLDVKIILVADQYNRYKGSMSRPERNRAVRAFMKTDSTVSALLMSLKCGGVGLNLTRGNRVISLDLSWSAAVEGQSYDRAHRLGQMKTVYIERLVIANSVEDRILELQERKASISSVSERANIDVLFRKHFPTEVLEKAMARRSGK